MAKVIIQKWLAIGLVAASAATLSAYAQNNTTAQTNDANKSVQTVSDEHAHSENGEENSEEAGSHAHGEGAAHGSTVHTHSTRMSIASAPSAIQAGKTATLTLKIVDNADGTPINDYEVVHDKKLHFIIVSSDLNFFNHIHPEFIGGGKFQVKTILPRAGTYRIYADYKPQGEEGEVALQEIKVGGAKPLSASTRLVPDTLRNGWMTKSVVSHLEGLEPTANAARYQVALMPMPSRIEAGKDVMLHFQVRDANGKPVAKLEPYLGAQGHCVILSNDPQIYLHTHPMDGGHEGHDMGGMGNMKMGGMDMSAMNGAASSPKTTAQSGADVMFHTNFPKAGLYKVWGQFKYNGKIISAPFVVNVGAAKAAANTQSSTREEVAVPTNAQKITVSLPDGYRKGAATVKAGEPVALTFKLVSNAGCGNTIVVPDANNWSKTLGIGQSATVVYTPKKSGTLNFACGMNMMKGSLVVQ